MTRSFGKQNGIYSESLRKFKINFKDSQVIVKCKLNKNDVISQKEMEVFNSKFIRGLMRPKITGDKKIEYLAPGNVSLSSYIKSGLTKKDFYLIFAQFVECLKKIEWNGFNINNLVLNTDYIIFNNVTSEVQFIYQPIENNQNTNNVFSFIYDLANQANATLSIEEDNSFLNHLISTLKSMKTVSPEVLENYIIKTYPQIYKKVRRSKPGESQSLKQTGRSYFEKKYEETGGNSFSTQDDDDATGLLDEDEEATGLLFEEDDEATGLLDEDEEGTTVLGDDDGTALLENNEPVFPYLIRINTYEKVKVNKPVFRIGKENSYVDYFVMSNNAVSRIHADIITENNQYFIKDNNSTNHTFVNGTMIPVNQNVEIFDGDALMLANEPFEFHVY